MSDVDPGWPGCEVSKDGQHVPSVGEQRGVCYLCGVFLLRRRPDAIFRPESFVHLSLADDMAADEAAAQPSEPERRLLDCVTAWPDCESGSYDPRCCRFPKSCSPYPYPEQLAAGNVELEGGRARLGLPCAVCADPADHDGAAHSDATGDGMGRYGPRKPDGGFPGPPTTVRSVEEFERLYGTAKRDDWERNTIMLLAEDPANPMKLRFMPTPPTPRERLRRAVWTVRELAATGLHRIAVRVDSGVCRDHDGW